MLSLTTRSAPRRATEWYLTRSGLWALPTLTLRPHHYVCLPMYKGIARTEAQARHIGSVVRHIHTYGGSTRLVAGRDTMCGPCRCPQQHARDERMLKALNENLGMNLKIGDSVLITRAFTESVREVFPRLLEHCSPCRFYDDCAQIAASGFGGCKLWPRKANMAPLSLIRG